MSTGMEVSAWYRTNVPIANPEVLRDIARVRPKDGIEDAKFEVIIDSVLEVGVDRIVEALRRSKIRVNWFSLSCFFPLDFVNDPPEDCVGGVLRSDGYVSTPDGALKNRIVPLSEPVYTSGRPEADSEHKRYAPHVLGHLGGIPALSDQLIASLREMGAAGETGKIIYRGSKKDAYGTIQPGFKRFLVKPEYDVPRSHDFCFLPEELLKDFGVCSLLRRRTNPVRLVPRRGHVLPDQSKDTWYEIALNLQQCRELKQSYRHVLFNPIFGRNGIVHRWVGELESTAEELKG